jgi:predicted nucleic acid-binding Zn ribbon protein
MLKLQFFVLSVLSALDVITTKEALKFGLFEANPFIQDVVHNTGHMVLAKVVSLLVAGTCTWILQRNRYEKEVSSIIMMAIGILVAVVTMNAISIMWMNGMLT